MDVRFPRLEQAFDALGGSDLAQARALGWPYTTLRDWKKRMPKNAIRVLCLPEDLRNAALADIAANPSLCSDQAPPTDPQPPAS